MARRVISPTIAVRYSTLPLSSSTGLQAAMAASAAACMALASTVVPLERVGRRRHEQRRVADVGQRDGGIGALAPRQGQYDGGRRDGIIADFALDFPIGHGGAIGRGRDTNLDQKLVGFEGSRVDPFVKIRRGDSSRAFAAPQLIGRTERHHDGRIVVARIPVGAVSADGAAVAHLRIADLGRRFGQDRAFVAQQIGRQNLGLSGSRADDDHLAFFANTAKAVYAIDVDEMRRFRQTQFHHWNQAVAAGQHLAVVAEPAE